ncbi:ATP-binding cassette domain-containing protein (plasmid) [Peribacillus simplex]|uniref:ATP-binding cassette domain-containing protein n=1 Tax=Peribacillus simplex TaxID=1478 RepID=UPI003266AE3E
MEIVRLENICQEFNGNTVIENINFSINDGEMVAIMGKSGKGKTTLLNIMGLISKPSEGDLYYLIKRMLISTRKRQCY